MTIYLLLSRQLLEEQQEKEGDGRLRETAKLAWQIVDGRQGSQAVLMSFSIYHLVLLTAAQPSDAIILIFHSR